MDTRRAPTWFRVLRWLSVGAIAAGGYFIAHAYWPRTGVTYPGGMVYAIEAALGAALGSLGLLLLLLLYVIQRRQARRPNA